jgi:hypothetical protein
MRFSVPAIVLGLCTAFAAASPVPEPAGPGFNPSEVKITSVTPGGSGCPAGSVALSFNDAMTVFTVSFDNYLASIGPGIPITEKYKFCNINVGLKFPQGFQFTLYKIDYTGHVELENHVKATQRSTYWFAGEKPPSPPTLSSSWVGPMGGPLANPTFTDTLVEAAWVWSPCGESRNLNIYTQLFMENDKNPHGSGFVTTDVVDGKVKTLWRIQTRKCK